MSEFYVLVSDTPFTSNSLSQNLANANVDSFYFGATAGSPTRVDINGNGRYVRVQHAGTNPLSLAEVEVFGTDDSIIRDENYADIPDFSYVGYMTTGERDLPNYEMRSVSVPSINGDDGANIRAAINQVARLTPDANGYRGWFIYRTPPMKFRSPSTFRPVELLLKAVERT